MGERYPFIRDSYINDWFNTTPPGGESPKEMMVRVSACVDEIIARGEDALLVAHFGSLSLVMLHLGLLDREDAFEDGFIFEHSTYTAIRIEDGKAELIHFNR